MENKIPRIAVLDDDRQQTNLFKESVEIYLDGKTLHIDVFNTKDEMSEFRPLTYDLIILDHHLFGDENIGTGISFAKTIIDTGFYGKIVVYTGDLSIVEREKIDGVQILSKLDSESMHSLIGIVRDL
ncbi:MAG: hypothetical protein PHE67_00790 [Campylobacterales bacterium]|nr:hypothetical protein [Campylobacterales bacterium]